MPLVESTESALPIVVTIDQEGVGGVTGKAANIDIRIRDLSTTDEFLDFADNTFKAAAWGTLSVNPTEVDHAAASDGHYQYTFDVNAVRVADAPNMEPGFRFAVEVHIDGGGVQGDSSDEFLVVETIAELASDALLQDVAFSDAVWIDSVSGVAGTAFPLGTPSDPTSNLADGLTIAAARNLRKFRLDGAVTLLAGLTSWVVVGIRKSANALIILGGQSVDDTYFERVGLFGTCSGNFQAKECELIQVDGIDGVMRNCAISGTMTLDTDKSLLLERCATSTTSVNPTVDLVNWSGGTPFLIANEYSGDMVLANSTLAAGRCELNFSSGTLTINASCTAGTIIVRGNVDVVDNSAGATVIVEAALARTAIQDLILDDSTPFSGADIAAILNDTDVTIPALIATSESNIRGADSDDLKDISDEIGLLNNLSSAQAQTAAEAAIDSRRLDELVSAASANPLTGSLFELMMNKVSGGFGFNQTTDSLEALSDATPVVDYGAIADAVWDEATAGHVAAGSTGKALTDTLALVTALNNLSIADVQTAMTAQGYTAVRGALLDNLDAAVSTRAVPGDDMGLSAGGIVDVQTALTGQGYTVARAALLANLDAAITTRAVAGDAMALTAAAVDAIWDEPTAGHAAAGSTGKALTDAAAGGGATPAAIAVAVWDELLAGHVIAGSAGVALTTAAAGGGASAVTIAAAVWDRLLSLHTIAGSAGQTLTEIRIEEEEDDFTAEGI